MHRLYPTVHALLVEFCCIWSGGGGEHSHKESGSAADWPAAITANLTCRWNCHRRWAECMGTSRVLAYCMGASRVLLGLLECLQVFRTGVVPENALYRTCDWLEEAALATLAQNSEQPRSSAYTWCAHFTGMTHQQHHARHLQLRSRHQAAGHLSFWVAQEHTAGPSACASEGLPASGLLQEAS
jgi:hypothetical protein